MTDNTTKEVIITKLISNWEEVIAQDKSEDMHGIKDCIIEGLKSQLDKNEQGWDMSAEDYDSDEEFAIILGWDYLHDNEWREMVEEAARRFLDKYGATNG